MVDNQSRVHPVPAVFDGCRTRKPYRRLVGTTGGGFGSGLTTVTVWLAVPLASFSSVTVTVTVCPPDELYV